MARILVCDDDPSVLALVELLLGEEGHDVLTAADGTEGWLLLQDDPVDLAILDVMMPGMTGLEVLAAIRMQGELASMPVLMLTALSGPDDESEAWVRGCDGYVTKPFEPDDFVTFVADVLAEPAAVREQRRAGRLRDLMDVIDPSRGPD